MGKVVIDWAKTKQNVLAFVGAILIIAISLGRLSPELADEIKKQTGALVDWLQVGAAIIAVLAPSVVKAYSELRGKKEEGK